MSTQSKKTYLDRNSLSLVLVVGISAACLLVSFANSRFQASEIIQQTIQSHIRQTARLIALPVKLRDNVSLNRLMSGSSGFAETTFTQVTDLEGTVLYTEPESLSLAKSAESCDEKYHEEWVEWQGHKVGLLSFCMAAPMLSVTRPFTDLAFWLILFTIMIIGQVMAIVLPSRKLRFVAKELESLRANDEDYLKERERYLSGLARNNPLAEIFHSLVKRLIEAKKHEQELNLSLASTRIVQMVAHDVRKPFSLLGSAIQVFKGARTISEIDRLVPHLEASLKGALKNVNSMLSDIMDVGRDMELEIEPSSIKSLMHHALEETSYIYSEARVDIDYDWRHEHLVRVDPMRVQRVFSNILSNACQAMRAKDPIWIRTAERDGFIEVVIGNKGSSIPSEELSDIFRAFFTKREKGKGTGLGLAIAKKIVESHGGTIGARSSPEKNEVEFVLTLPVDSALDHSTKQALPSNLDEFSKLQSFAVRDANDLGDKGDRVSRRNKIVSFVSRMNKPLSIAVLDDEEFYRNSIIKLTEHNDLSSLIRLREFDTPAQLLETDTSELDLVISDVDLRSELNGYDVVRELRKRHMKLPICIHSNKALTQDYEMAVRSGATAFMPKPMTIDHLLRFITDCMDSSKHVYTSE